MVKRKVTLKIYILAFIITAAIFLVGVYVGQLVDTQVSENLMQEMKYYAQESISFQVMLLLEDSSSFCPLYLDESADLEQKTIELGEELTYLEQVKGVYDNDLKKQYLLLETKAYLLATKVNELCGYDKALILYFYSKECGECELQGEILDQVAGEKGDSLRIYSFDGELDSPVVESFKGKYDIDSYPTLIINGVKVEGLKVKQELLNILE